MWNPLNFRNGLGEIAAKCPENKQKSQWNHWKINGKSVEIYENLWILKGKFKTSSKVDKSVKKNCDVKILLRIRGGDPPQMQYFDILQFFHTFFTLCVYFWSLFGLFLWNSLLCWGGKLDFSMISLAFLVIFQAFAATSKSHENPRFFSQFLNPAFTNPPFLLFRLYRERWPLRSLDT